MSQVVTLSDEERNVEIEVAESATSSRHDITFLKKTPLSSERTEASSSRETNIPALRDLEFPPPPDLTVRSFASSLLLKEH